MWILIKSWFFLSRMNLVFEGVKIILEINPEFLDDRRYTRIKKPTNNPKYISYCSDRLYNRNSLAIHWKTKQNRKNPSPFPCERWQKYSLEMDAARDVIVPALLWHVLLVCLTFPKEYAQLNCLAWRTKGMKPLFQHRYPIDAIWLAHVMPLIKLCT